MKKTNKLRHAEYYSMQSLLDQLYMQSKNGNNFYKLTRLMQKEENIQLAYRNIKKNMGSHTAGVDGKTIYGFRPNRNAHHAFARVNHFLNNQGRGRCAISGVELGLHNWECHHKVPLKNGGTDKYDNLIIILDSFHKAIHKSEQTELQTLMELYRLPDEKRVLCSELYELVNQ